MYFNRQGFRTREELGPSRLEKLESSRSAVDDEESVGNEDGLHWPLWTERTLRTDGLPVRVYNSGMSAYTTAHTLVRLAFDVLDFAPDIVVVLHNVNDLAELSRGGRGPPGGRPLSGSLRGQGVHQRFLEESDIVLSRLWCAVAWPSPQWPPGRHRRARRLRHQQGHLEDFQRRPAIQALASARGTRLVLLTMPVGNSPEIATPRCWSTRHRG